MKKMIAVLLLTVTLALAICSCGPKPPVEDPGNGGGDTPIEEVEWSNLY
ncbi:MAG: hypothetical protein MJ082_06090 [Clostridia bacterium]|nr:hypothetical protein [Clostridia bacterium]